MNGAFQTSRELFSNPIWKNIVEFRLFFLIYGSAVFAEEGYRVTDDLHLQRGQWLRSTRKIQEDLEYIENRQVKKYSTSVINRSIKSLIKSERIVVTMHELGTVFTVLNYDDYQQLSNYRLQDTRMTVADTSQVDCTKTGQLGTLKKYDNHATEQVFSGHQEQNLEQNLEQRWNSVGTIEEQHQNNNKNVKKEKNDKKVNKEIIYSPEFDLFWDSYPKQVGKPSAFNNWKKLLKKHTAEYLIACGMNYQSYCIANGTDNQYMKLPNNFLNAKEEYYKQFESPVLIHSKGGGQARGKTTTTSKIQELYRQAEEDERREAHGGY